MDGISDIHGLFSDEYNSFPEVESQANSVDLGDNVFVKDGEMSDHHRSLLQSNPRAKSQSG